MKIEIYSHQEYLTNEVDSVRNAIIDTLALKGSALTFTTNILKLCELLAHQSIATEQHDTNKQYYGITAFKAELETLLKKAIGDD